MPANPRLTIAHESQRCGTAPRVGELHESLGAPYTSKASHEGLDAETLHVTLKGRGMWVFGYVNGPSLATKPYASTKPDCRAIGYRFAHRRADPATRELLREVCR
jgi:hypothetical protein